MVFFNNENNEIDRPGRQINACSRRGALRSSRTRLLCGDKLLHYDRDDCGAPWLNEFASATEGDYYNDAKAQTTPTTQQTLHRLSPSNRTVVEAMRLEIYQSKIEIGLLATIFDRCELPCCTPLLLLR